MPDVEENKTVDIDTSGPDTEVELDNSTEENTEQATAESTETSSTETVETASEEKKEEPKKEEKEKELEQYSESVQRRIAKLTHKWREAQRQADDAAEFARAQIKLKEEAEQKISKLEPGFMKSTEDSIKSGLEAAKAQLAKAREAGDINAEVEAQALISEYGYKQAKFAETKTQQEEFNKQKQTEVRTPEINLNRQRQADPTPDPKAETWAARNTWFGQDTAMTYTAFDLHKKLTEQEGYDPSSDEYYQEIDKRIRLEFPHKFDTNRSNLGEGSTKPVQTVASAKRSTNTGRKTVRLTPSQVAIAKKLGVPLEEYAKQLKITKEV
jgi:GH15 family glucan-1,4-alpha-glucosidase